MSNLVREPDGPMHALAAARLRVCVAKQQHDAAHVEAAIALFQAHAHGTHRFIVPELVEPGGMYDWADPATRKVGQCWTNADGTAWLQDPLGENPVVLEAIPLRRRRRG